MSTDVKTPPWGFPQATTLPSATHSARPRRAVGWTSRRVASPNASVSITVDGAPIQETAMRLPASLSYAEVTDLRAQIGRALVESYNLGRSSAGADLGPQVERPS